MSHTARYTLPFDHDAIRKALSSGREVTGNEIAVLQPSIAHTSTRTTEFATSLGHKDVKGLIDLLTSAAFKVKETMDGRLVIYVSDSCNGRLGYNSNSKFFADAKTTYCVVELDLLENLDRVYLDKTVCEFLYVQSLVFVGEDLYFKKRPIIVNAKSTKALGKLINTLEKGTRHGAYIEVMGDNVVVSAIL